VLPRSKAPSFDGLKLEKLVVPSPTTGRRALERIAAEPEELQGRAKKGKKAADGDQLIIDFVGKLDGVEFDGGKAEKTRRWCWVPAVHPRLRRAAVGVKAGEEKTITVTFPADYPAENLKGKEADLRHHREGGEGRRNQDRRRLRQVLGLESLDKLREILLRGQLEQETAGLTRTQMKRALLDQLAAGHDFDVPPTMVEAEFEQIWQQLQQEAAEARPIPPPPEGDRGREGRLPRIAERRVRLGLLLSEIGQANGVEVTQQEMSDADPAGRAAVPPEDRQRFVEYIQQRADGRRPAARAAL
jgi:trigger factor